LFVNKVRTYLPKTKIIYLPIKPSLKRWDKWQEMEKTNSIIQSFSDRHDNLFYADTATPMLTAEGKPNPDLFLDDGLHLNDEGYELWTLILAPLLTDLSRN
jgi:lysophospholipase L1-like esterase